MSIRQLFIPELAASILWNMRGILFDFTSWHVKFSQFRPIWKRLGPSISNWHALVWISKKNTNQSLFSYQIVNLNKSFIFFNYIKFSRYEDRIHWFVPGGSRSWFESLGISSENIHDLVWWQSKVMPLSGGKIQDSNSEGEEITIVKV